MKRKISLTLTRAEITRINEALSRRYQVSDPEAELPANQRSHFLRLALWAFSTATAQAPQDPTALACRTRRETLKEANERVEAMHAGGIIPGFRSLHSPKAAPEISGFAFGQKFLLWRKGL